VVDAVADRVEVLDDIVDDQHPQPKPVVLEPGRNDEVVGNELVHPLNLTRPMEPSRFRQICPACSVHWVTRFVVDCETLLRIAAGEIEVAAEHKLVAPTLVRSQALSALYEAARRGEISAAEGIERVTRINSLKVRFLGDKVLQRQAKVADELGWETTYDAEYVALTKLQADVFVTSNADLAQAVSRLVETATVDALRA
jgi:predicted nucleic acid-binding protein